MDLIALYQAGIRNVVASSGTSLTEEQIKLLSRFTKNINIIFDADEAGQSASLRSIELLLKEDFDVKLITLPKGEDPDSFINKFGRKEFEDLLKKTKNFLEYQLETYKQKGLMDDPLNQSKAIRQLVKSVSVINDELKRNLMIKSISKKFNIREKLIETELDKFIKKRAPEKERIITTTKAEEKVGKKNNINNNGQNYKLELEIIRLLFEGNEEILDNIFDNILPEDFKNESLKKIAQMVLENYRNDIISPSVLIEKLEDEEKKDMVLKLSLEDTAISPKHGEDLISETVLKNHSIQYSRDVVKKIRLLRLDEQINLNKQKILNNPSSEEIIELLKLNKELEQEKRNIRNSADSKKTE
jgi:DNA primase